MLVEALLRRRKMHEGCWGVLRQQLDYNIDRHCLFRSGLCIICFIILGEGKESACRRTCSSEASMLARITCTRVAFWQLFGECNEGKDVGLSASQN